MGYMNNDNEKLLKVAEDYFDNNDNDKFTSDMLFEYIRSNNVKFKKDMSKKKIANLLTRSSVFEKVDKKNNISYYTKKIVSE